MNTFLRLEKCLLPFPEIIRYDRGSLISEQYSLTQKVSYFVKNFFCFIAILLFSPLTIPYDLISKKETTPIKIPDTIPNWPPKQRGFACSFFQSSGLGTKWSATKGLIGKCDWDQWMENPKHIVHEKGFEYKNFFTDILTNPDSYIEMLKNHNVTAHRFSLEWSVLCPASYEFDTKAIVLYQNLIKKLISAGITPSVTLNHFVLPDWFYKNGGFQNEENISHFVDFALAAIKLFPEVNDWWSFNELGIKAFQQTREVYPTDLPEGSSLSARIHAAGITTRNMLISHCLLHKKVQELYPDKKLGVTHQWLKFDTENGNLLESILAYYFTKFAFTPVYQFFKEGNFSFEFPFIANIQFKIPQDQFESNDHFLSRIGVQAYPKPMLKMGLNHGNTYPGPPSSIKNFPLLSFGITCEKGGTVMRFGPRWNAEGIKEALDDAFAITPNVFITEYGSDAVVQKWGQPYFAQDNEAQAEYLQALTEQIQQYCLTTFREIQGIFCWSDLRHQLEWDNGLECQLGLIETKLNGSRQIVSYTQTPASQYLSKLFYSADRT